MRRAKLSMKATSVPMCFNWRARRKGRRHLLSTDVGRPRGSKPRIHSTEVTMTSRKTLWAGRVMSGFAVLFLLVDATVKVLELPPALEATTQLGYPASVVFGLGVLQLACLVVYLVPRTSVLGAVLWTGYLGGAVATHVRVGNPLFSHALPDLRRDVPLGWALVARRAAPLRPSDANVSRRNPYRSRSSTRISSSTEPPRRPSSSTRARSARRLKASCASATFPE